MTRKAKPFAVERRAIAQIAGLRGKVGGVGYSAAERNPWASAGLCGGLNDMPEKGDL